MRKEYDVVSAETDRELVGTDECRLPEAVLEKKRGKEEEKLAVPRLILGRYHAGALCEWYQHGGGKVGSGEA